MADLVVARFDEDVRWVADVARALGTDVRVFVYNKGPAETLPWATRLPNVGREAHTFLHHIATMHAEYASSPGRSVVFLQGCIRDHAAPGASEADVVRGLVADARANDGASVTSMSTHPEVGSAYMAQHDFRIPSHRGQRLLSAGETLGSWVAREVDPVATFPLPFWIGALFCCDSKLLAAARPAAGYARLRDLLAASGPNPELAHFVERSWPAIIGVGG